MNTPSAFAKESLLFVQETGNLRALRRHTSVRSNLSSYLFFVVMSGEGSLEYCGRKYELSGGDCVFLDCMLPYSHTAGDALWELKWAHFNSRTMGEIYERYTTHSGKTVFHPEDMTPFSELLDRLYDAVQTRNIAREMKINELLASLLTLIVGSADGSADLDAQPPGTSAKNTVGEIKEYVDGHWREKISLDSVSERFFINKFYLTKLFKRRYGTTLIEYILDLRITQAKKLLRFSDDRVETIARECGFEDPNYFSRAFKKLEGVTPTKYRTMWTNKD